jgi:deazaflavin-dependent oxidoreductase (nitroreductase family)
VIVGYVEDGPNLVTMAMNSWGDAEPAWWLNLQAHPDVAVDLAGGPRQVTGRAAQGDERERLWPDGGGSTRTSMPTPRAAPGRPR